MMIELEEIFSRLILKERILEPLKKCLRAELSYFRIFHDVFTM